MGVWMVNYGEAIGKSKKDGEQKAAKIAINLMQRGTK